MSAAVWRRAHLTPRRYVRSISIAKDGIPVSLFPSRREVTVLSRYARSFAEEVLREVPQAMDGPQAACGILLISSRLLGKRTPWAHAQPARHQLARTTPVVASDQVCSLPTGGLWLQAYLLCLAVPYRTVPGPLGLVALAALAAVSPPEVAPCCQ